MGGRALEVATSAPKRVAACDIGDGADGVALLAFARPAGVLHAAGVLHDRMLRSMATDDVCAVFEPKALGASHVHAMVACTALEAFGLFSSVASTFGNVGQANYAAANAYLDAVARSRRCLGIVVSSLQIPAVSGSGMGATTFGKEQLHAIGAVSLDEFAAFLCIALAPARAAMERTLAPFAKHLLASAAILEDSSQQVSHGLSIGRQGISSTQFEYLTLLPEKERLAYLEVQVSRLVSPLVGGLCDWFTVDTELMDSGVDSIASQELTRIIEQEMGIRQSPGILFQYPTVRTLAEHILESFVVVDICAVASSIPSEIKPDNWGQMLPGAGDGMHV